MVGKKNCVIILDTNSIYYDLEDDFSKIFNNNVLDLKQFLDKNKLTIVEISIPEIVIQERVTQRLEKSLSILERLKNDCEKLKIFGIKISDVPKNDEIRKQLLDSSSKFVKKGFIVYPIPKPDIEEIIKKSYLKIAPFQSGGKGFKDAILWYSILENCKDKNIILVSNDSVFSENKDYFSEELKKSGGRQFEIFKTLEDTKSFLRKLFNLDENVEKVHEQIKEGIEKNINNFLFEVIGERYHSYGRSFNRRMLVGGFLIKELIFKNISENYLFVDLTVRVKTKLFESPEEKENELYEAAMYTDIIKTPYWSPFRYSSYPVEMDLAINIKLHKVGEDYKVAEHSINEDYGS